MMLGHSLGLDDAYLRLSEEEVLAEYLKAVDSLTINNENRLQKQVTELTQKHDDIEDYESRTSKERSGAS